MPQCIGHTVQCRGPDHAVGRPVRGDDRGHVSREDLPGFGEVRVAPQDPCAGEKVIRRAVRGVTWGPGLM